MCSSVFISCCNCGAFCCACTCNHRTWHAQSQQSLSHHHGPRFVTHQLPWMTTKGQNTILVGIRLSVTSSLQLQRTQELVMARVMQNSCAFSDRWPLLSARETHVERKLVWPSNGANFCLAAQLASVAIEGFRFLSGCAASVAIEAFKFFFAAQLASPSEGAEDSPIAQLVSP